MRFRSGLMQRIALPGFVVIVALVVSYGFFSWQVNSHSGLMRENTVRLKSMQFFLNQVNANFSELERNVLTFRYTGEPGQALQMARNADEIRSSLNQIEQLPLTPRSRELISDLRTTAEQADLTRLELVEAVREGENQAIRTVFRKWVIRSQYLSATLSDLNAYSSIRLLQEVGELQEKQKTLSVIILSILLAAGIGLLGFTVYLYQTVVRPIVGITEVARTISEGKDLSLLAPGEDLGDEIGVLAGAFNRMTRQLTTTNTELQHAIHSRDNFISIASHELKTPLTSLSLYVQMLQRSLAPEHAEPPNREQLTKTAEVMSRQLGRLNVLISDLLDVTRIRAGKVNFRFENCDLSQITREAFAAAEQALKQAGCRVELSLEDGLVGRWDASRLEQVLANLISNAIKYAPGSPLRIHTFRSESQAILRFQDSGPGIPKADQVRIFERFERATGATRMEGMGLGLFIVKSIVQSHRGTIEIESNPGEGTVFTVTLPLG